MNPLLLTKEDSSTLQDLGRASIQIVHDLKNQLNGLKLYATFLKKRIEKSDRPDDERETVEKLISGLDRAASDLSTIVEYGREIELKKQPEFDVQKVMRSICSSLNESDSAIVCESEATPLKGSFDPSKLTDAFKWISQLAIKQRAKDVENQPVTFTIKSGDARKQEAVLQWAGLGQLNHDPFRSFAGSDEIRTSLAAKIVEAHGGSATYTDKTLVVTLPLSE